jgi:hypothetical protein
MFRAAGSFPSPTAVSVWVQLQLGPQPISKGVSGWPLAVVSPATGCATPTGRTPVAAVGKEVVVSTCCSGYLACSLTRGPACLHPCTPFPAPPPLSGMQINMRVDEQCKVLCRIEALTEEQADAFEEKIADDYKVNL